jgi:hypothetical protein
VSGNHATETAATLLHLLEAIEKVGLIKKGWT